MRHWLRKRAAFTRPNFGTAIRMSNTFAVETYSGGALRIVSILTRPSFKSFFSLARLTRMSLARFSASILWSRDRAGAWAWAFVDDTIERASLTTSPRGSITHSRGYRRPRPFDSALVRDAACLVDIAQAERRNFGIELGTNPYRRVGIAEEDCAECDVRCSRCDELERVASCHDSAHSDDRQRG